MGARRTNEGDLASSRFGRRWGQRRVGSVKPRQTMRQLLSQAVHGNHRDQNSKGCRRATKDFLAAFHRELLEKMQYQIHGASPDASFRPQAREGKRTDPTKFVSFRQPPVPSAKRANIPKFPHCSRNPSRRCYAIIKAATTNFEPWIAAVDGLSWCSHMSRQRDLSSVVLFFPYPRTGLVPIARGHKRKCHGSDKFSSPY